MLLDFDIGVLQYVGHYKPLLQEGVQHELVVFCPIAKGLEFSCHDVLELHQLGLEIGIQIVRGHL